MTRPLIIDSFAGGGGASTGIEIALGRSPDYAINHDADALAMHAANHPDTVHLSRNIWQVDPIDVVGRRPVGLLWSSPDCKHFSKAKGSRPVKRNIRDLAWTVVLWAKRARPRVIILENVEEFREWGPVIPIDTGDGTLYRPCPERKGETFERWVGELKRLGYRVQWRELVAADYGAPTIRKRLFLIARCDGRPIVWPEPTHGDPKSESVRSGRLKPWHTAAEIIDWSLPCPSIFATSEEIKRIWGVRANRPLAPATMARIAKGVMRYVIQAAEPFIIPVTHAVNAPLPTIVPTGNGASLVAAFLAQHNTDMVGHPATAPVSTIVGKGCTQGLVAAHMLTLRGSGRRDAPIDEPCPTVSAGGNHAATVAAFLAKYYGAGDPSQAVTDPLHTVTTKPRHSLVTVTIAGEPYVIVDIGMRMLTPRERARAQGFPDSYILDRGADGRSLSAEAQGRMIGNSVCPPVAAALVAANCSDLAITQPADAAE